MELRGNPIQVVVEERDVNDVGRDLPPTVVKSLEGEMVTVIIPPGMTPKDKSNVVRKWVMEWYRQEAWDHLKARVADYGNVMGVQTEPVEAEQRQETLGQLQWETIDQSQLEANHAPRSIDRLRSGP